MKLRVSVLVSVMLLLWTSVVWGSGYYEDDMIRLSISKGWDVLSAGMYVFTGVYPFAGADHPTRLQDKVSKEHGGSMSKQQLIAAFGDDFTPVLVSAFRKAFSQYFDLAITHLYTPATSFTPNELCGWERSSNRITQSMGAYCYLEVPAHLAYEIFFLLPTELIADKMFAVFDVCDSRLMLTVDEDGSGSVADRIVTLEREIERLRALMK